MAFSTVFITDKNGNRQDKTKDIERIQFDKNKKLYIIKFKRNEILYTYKQSNIEIIKNQQESSIQTQEQIPILKYFMKIANFSDIKNELTDENLLIKTLSKLSTINKESILFKYINPKTEVKKIKNNETLIFPFGANNSQINAVENAMTNQLSIIQGPPGTGKTQTILNIIANILIRKKTVLIVSNNNDATQNVLDKLSSSKYQLDFLCATLGKTENVDTFVKKQKEKYPDYLQEWQQIFFPGIELEKEIETLKEYFSAQERISLINNELSTLQTEQKYFMQHHKDFYTIKKSINLLADDILYLIEKIQFKSSKKEQFSLWQTFYLKHKYKLKDKTQKKLNPSKFFATLKSLYYSKKIDELLSEKKQKEELLKTYNPEKAYKESFDILKREIALKYLHKKSRDYFSEKDVYNKIMSFTLEYPIVLSTTFSSKKVLGASKDFLFDYLIMDESSQVDIVTGAIALSCAKNAVIVGDKKQLPNVIPEQQKEEILKIFCESKLDEGYCFTNSFLDSIEKIIPNTPQTLLREHYRCHPKIINFCNQQFYGGKLLIMTKDSNEENVLSAIKTISGKFEKNHYNQRQIDVIKTEVLPNILQSEISNLGIIAPYNNQVNEIKRQIPQVDVATVHKFQGREKDTIIISTVDDKITKFTDDPNMMNVAISRAKNKLFLIVSGNEQPEDSNVQALLKYIQYNNFEIKQSNVISIFDFLYTKSTKTKFDFLNKTKRISKFNSENAMNNLLSEIIQQDEFSIFDFVFELPLKEIVSTDFLNSLSTELFEYANNDWTHVDFTIFNRVTKEFILGIEVDGYTYHKKGTKQSLRDKKKDEIFELLQLPLLRFSTKGANEKQIIENKLMELSAIKENE